MEQTKALNALEPFLALSKSATSPRAAADLIIHATSAANTFIFAELLQTPQIQNLASLPPDDEHSPYLKLLEIFSYGDYESYHHNSSNAASPTASQVAPLPPLNDAQTLKLRQLSLLSLARDRRNLSYQVLQSRLGLSSAREVENLVITAVYANLLQATLDPARETVQISSISPLRDVTPGTSVPDMIKSLQAWSSRCTTILSELDTQMTSIRRGAAEREHAKMMAMDKMDSRIAEALQEEGATSSQSRGQRSQQQQQQQDMLMRNGRMGKRSILSQGTGSAPTDPMPIDDTLADEERKKRSTGKRKM